VNQNRRLPSSMRSWMAKVTRQRMQELIEHAGRNRAPKRLVAQYDSR
jgi:hypothetical protein